MKVHIQSTLTTIIDSPSSFVNSLPAIIKRRLPEEIAIVSVSSKESQKLNRLYRTKDRPTNVLSFFYDKTYGEIIVCPAA
ncbi:MAG: rRNA maturation RNAse YbeY, partial [Candidatus Sungbacteria bacterium]|nr:rRNA maturation RNAse YbeY [Candidatus Sungbacteria bacterium]